MEEELLRYIEIGVTVVELIAVLIIVIAVVYSSLLYVSKIIKFRRRRTEDYNIFRVNLARALILGLEIMVAADIIQTVALDTSLQSVAVLGLLVLIRTFLSWSLVVEIEGRWPWQKKPQDISEASPKL
jgi:uncharacterized membrane protein